MESLELRRLLASMELDISFGSGGITQISDAWSEAYVVNELPSGKIVIAGSGSFIASGGSGEGRPLVARLNPDGTFDTTFDGDGRLSPPQVPTGFGYTPDAALGFDEKIVILHRSADVKVLRFNADGTLDTSFGTNGVASHDIPGLEVSTEQIAVQPDGKIVFTYSSGSLEGPQQRLGRLNADGSVDNTFRGGLGSSQFTGLRFSDDIRVADDGKIYVVGYTTGDDAHLFRFNADGTIDNSFSGDGNVDVDPSPDGRFSRLALDRAGRPYVVTQLSFAHSQTIIMARFTTSGAPDTTFGGDGRVDLQPYPQGPVPSSFLIGRDGKITGALNHDWPSVAALYRLLPNGEFDTTYGVNGKVIPNREVFDPQVLTYDRAGNILLAGRTSPPHSDRPIGMAAARFVPDGPDAALDADGRLFVQGSTGNDTITLRQSGIHTIVNRNGVDTPFPLKSIKTLSVYGLEGDDRITVPFTIDSTIVPGMGNDLVDLRDGNVTVIEDASVADINDGNDSIFAGAGDHIIHGGDGNNAIATGTGRDRITTGAGNDVIRTGSGGDFIDSGGGDDNIKTANGEDRIYTGEGKDFVDAGGGGDVIQDVPYPTVEGAISFVGTTKGAKTYNGNLGDDTIAGGSENDSLFGAGGNDEIFSSDGSDSVIGGPGNDRLSNVRPDAFTFDASDRDTIQGDEGNDTITGQIGNEVLEGGDGDDSIDGSQGDDYITGGAGSDTLFGGWDNDKLYGGADNDSVWGGDGDDRIYGDEGVDSLYGNGGRGRIDGGANSDHMRGNAGRDKLFGGHGNDRIYGSESADWLYGGIGDDQLLGEGSNDILYGEAGADTLEGLAGDDVLISNDGLIDDLTGGRGRDTAIADADDLLTGIEVVS